MTESQANSGSKTSEDSRLRDLSAIPEALELETLFISQVVTGSDDSAPQRDLEHKLFMESYSSNSLTLKAKFRYPFSVSIGSEPDELQIGFRDPMLFISKASGRQISAQSRIIKKELPRQSESSSWLDNVVNEETLVSATAVAFTANVAVTVIFSASLNAMFNLLMICQMLVFLRHVVKLPASPLFLLDSIEEAMN